MPQTGNQTEIKVKPLGATPTYNETIVVLDSPNKQSDNFKWLISIYKGVPSDTVYELISNITILPNIEGYGVIDFHRIVENYISTSFFPDKVERVSEKVLNEGLKWSFTVTEQFENPRWRFDDNAFVAGGDVGFTTDQSVNPAYSNSKHPFKINDEVSIVQDPGYTHSEYNTGSTLLTIENDYQVNTTITYEGATTFPEAGLMTLVGGGSRIIIQDIPIDDRTFYSFNGVLSFQGFRNWDSSEYTMTDASPDTTKFLLDGHREFDVTLNDRVWLNTLFGDTAPSLVGIETDNGEYYFQQIYNPQEQHFINQTKIGPVDLLETTDSSIIVVTGTVPMVDDDTTFIKITMNTTPSSQHSEVVTLNIVDKCSKYEEIRFFYMDKLGSYLPLTFNKVSRTNITNERKNYKQNYGNYDSVSNTWGYNTHDRGQTTYDLNSTERVTCTSDWLNQVEVDMVIDMLNSPIVYIQDNNGDYIAITITTNTFEPKKTINDKLRNYTLTFEFANNNGSQRG